MLDSVALVVHLSALGYETLASLSAATCQNGATIFGGHASAETELALAAAFGRLVSSLAHNDMCD